MRINVHVSIGSNSEKKTIYALEVLVVLYLYLYAALKIGLYIWPLFYF